MSKQPTLPICVYTIVHSDKLDELWSQCKTAGEVEIKENRNWATAQRLLKEAQAENLRMMVVFAAAEYTHDLIYYGTLASIKISKKSSNKAVTTFRVAELTRFKGIKPLKTSLIVESSGKAIPDRFIRPYAICKTPKLLMAHGS